MDSSQESFGRISSVVPLRAEDSYGLRLCRGSRFTSGQLAAQIATYPDLAFRSRGVSEYAIGGLWRQRAEIGLILELRCEDACEGLIAFLLAAYSRRGCPLVLVDPREQERNDSAFHATGFRPVQTIMQMEWHTRTIPNLYHPSKIRPMAADDVSAVLEIERKSFPWLWWNSEAELLWYAGIQGVELYVATLDDERNTMVGYAGFTVFEGHGHLDRLAVDRDYQGRGYGRGLLAFAVQTMLKLRVTRVALTTQLDNLRSQALYRRFGFKESGWQHELLGMWLRPPRPEETI